MVEVTTNIKNGDEVFAKKELEMFGHVFANEGDYFKVDNVSNEKVKLTSDKIDLMLDRNTFDEHFSKKVEQANNDKNTGYFYSSKGYIKNIVDSSDIARSVVFNSCLIVACKLPNGYVIVESCPCVNADDEKSKEIAYSLCMDKIYEKIEELESYVIVNNEYEYECWEENNCTCDECGYGEMPECFDMERCLDCEESSSCDCWDAYCNLH